MNKIDMKRAKQATLAMFPSWFHNAPATSDGVKKLIVNVLEMLEVSDSASEEDRNYLHTEITRIHAVTNGKMISVVDKDASRWLYAKKQEIDWGHWTAYEHYLAEKERSKSVIDENEKVIDTILDYTGDPIKQGPWAKKGLAMGNVQSGKTQNYLGLINKAIDVGYKIIIVLGGHQNHLRKQTQVRVDEGVLGEPSRHKEILPGQKPEQLGKGKYYSGKNYIHTATTTIRDFHKKFAESCAIKLDKDQPVIFTVKKDAKVMNTLFDWIRETHFLNTETGHLLDGPMLLIDDESDYASINTKHHKEKVTTTNDLIRKLLSLTSRSLYVAYTATPFANIFIDPDISNYRDDDDLFPSDFMVRLPLPSNYMGEQFFFGDEATSAESNAEGPLIVIDDHEPIHNLKNADETHYDLPESLKDAIRAFFIVIAVRAIRGQGFSHNTMLVNISYLKKHQNYFEKLIEEYKTTLCEALNAYGCMGSIQARKSELISSLEKTYNDNFKIEESYDSVLEVLSVKKRESIKVWALNQSGGKNDRHNLDYENYEDYGLDVIVIGGHKLSRGLTLEGLSISYFARNSKAYDTLLQMCRWFGYRESYKDLCKLYLPSESIEWYAHISEVIDELYQELAVMAAREERPKYFGLKVREHPGAMLVTALNKIGAGKSSTISMSLWGQISRRFKFKPCHKTNLQNVTYAKKFLEKICTNPSHKTSNFEDGGSLVVSNVSYQNIIDFIKAVNLTEDNIDNKILINQLLVMEKNDFALPKVVLYNQKSQKRNDWYADLCDEDKEFLDKPFEVAGQSLMLATRSLVWDGSAYRYPSSNLGNKDDEKLFLTKNQGDLVRSSSGQKAPVDHQYIASKDRNFVGLKIYFIGCTKRIIGDDKSTPVLIHGQNPTLGYTISFPRLENHKGLSPQQLKALNKKSKHSYKLNATAQKLDIYKEEYDED